MSKDLLRILGTLLIAFGLMAGSLGVAGAGAAGIPAPDDSSFVEVDNEFDADQDAEGGDADNEVDNDQDIENDQENDQEQDQDADQDQDVDQDGENELEQENALDSATGGSAGGDCLLDQIEIADNSSSDGGDQDANAGAADSAECAFGDSAVGDSTGGDSNQANAAEQGVENENDASQDLGDQDQTNDMDNENQQAIANELDADGGDADAEADAVFVNEIVAVLVGILDSILGSGNDNTIVPSDEEDVPTLAEFCVTAEIIQEPASEAELAEAIELGFIEPGDDIFDLFDVCADELGLPPPPNGVIVTD